MIRGAAAAVALLATLSGLAACGGAAGDDMPPGAASLPPAADAPAAAGQAPAATPTRPAQPQAPAVPEVGPQYVALGDSYAAAPGVPVTDDTDGCFRSSGNYAQQVARATGLTVTDVTCSGATTDTVLTTQVPALTPETELVTLGVGGNDFDLFSDLIFSCLDLPDADPDGPPCAETIRAGVDRTVPQIADGVSTLLDAITAAAPRAQVVVVGYPDLMPATGTCPDRIPLAVDDYPLLNELTRGLSGVLRAEADLRGLDFVDLERPSRGHDICSAQPWVSGLTVTSDGPIPFHPFPAEQRAVARKVVAFL